jgi:hypothetical protein
MGKSPEKWPLRDNGTKVKTTRKTTPDSEWTEEARANRKWGVKGMITHYHDSHDLCYDVRHDNGTEGCYEPTEFEVLS